ncbi:MAG: uracil-DNA glycosylase [Rickettsiales bacterium]|jgi:DNA polymerase|nr:uracil-DNA glycosylase [Rickettsiales bacterium]
MREDIIVLLEWLSANGIQEIFDDLPPEEGCQSDIIKPTQDKSLDNVFSSLAKQQNALRQNGLLFNNLDKIRSLADGCNAIRDLVEIAEKTEYYSEKRKLANNTIVFKGREGAKILVINDLPSESDDLNNDIFYGEPWELLKKMFGAIGAEEKDFSVVNSFFWRLAGGRSPIREELHICRPFVEKIISLARPKIIVFMGNYSLSILSGENQTIMKARGKFFDYTNAYLRENIPATGLYAPDFLLKNQNKKRDAWEDLQAIGKYL